MGFELGVVTCNLSNAEEFGKFISSREKVPLSHDELTKKSNEKYAALAKGVFAKILMEFKGGPDLICLQELNSRLPEQKELLKTLNNFGYTIVGEKTKDTAIAFKNSKFKLEKEGIADKLNPTIYADLREKASNKVVRVISDHVPGFNIAKGNLKVEKKDRYNDDAEAGDLHLKMVMKETDPELEANEKSGPCAVIYAADTNTTGGKQAKNIDAIHSRRLESLYENGFIEDDTDREPTTFDANTGVAYKYDHILVKGVAAEVEVEDLPVKGLTGLEALASGGRTYMSDHLPVFAKVIIKP